MGDWINILINRENMTELVWAVLREFSRAKMHQGYLTLTDSDKETVAELVKIAMNDYVGTVLH